MSKLHKVLLSAAVALCAVTIAIVVRNPVSDGVFGAVSQSSEYQATSTKNSTGTTLTTRVINESNGCATSSAACPGTLGSVVVLGAAAGAVEIYDATTTDVNLRTGNIATSSLPVFSITASAAAGEYPCDCVFFKGILVTTGATAPTSTITWRAR